MVLHVRVLLTSAQNLQEMEEESLKRARKIRMSLRQKQMGRFLDSLQGAFSSIEAVFMDGGIEAMAIMLGPVPVLPREMIIVHFHQPSIIHDETQCEQSGKEVDNARRLLVRTLITEGGELFAKSLRPQRIFIYVLKQIGQARKRKEEEEVEGEEKEREREDMFVPKPSFSLPMKRKTPLLHLTLCGNGTYHQADDHDDEDDSDINHDNLDLMWFALSIPLKPPRTANGSENTL